MTDTQQAAHRRRANMVRADLDTSLDVADITITASPVFWVHMTIEEVCSLEIMALNHYDGECQAMARFGGRVYAWKSLIGYQLTEREPTIVKADWHELDLASKVCENLDALPKDKRQRMKHLSRRIHKAMEESRKLNDIEIRV